MTDQAELTKQIGELLTDTISALYKRIDKMIKNSVDEANKNRNTTTGLTSGQSPAQEPATVLGTPSQTQTITTATDSVYTSMMVGEPGTGRQPHDNCYYKRDYYQYRASHQRGNQKHPYWVGHRRWNRTTTSG